MGSFLQKKEEMKRKSQIREYYMREEKPKTLRQETSTTEVFQVKCYIQCTLQCDPSCNPTYAELNYRKQITLA